MAKGSALSAYKSGEKAARGKRKRRKGSYTIPLAVVGGFVPAILDIKSAFHVAGFDGALGHVSLLTTGYDPSDGNWKPAFAARYMYGPVILGAIVHKMAGKMGINKALGRMGIPFFRI
jgi:hypothetical protein